MTAIMAGVVATAAATTTLAGAAVAGAAGDRAMLSDRPEAAAGEVDTAVVADLGVAHPQADPEEAVVQAEASLVVAVPAAVASMAEVRAAEEALEGADMVVAVTVAPVGVDATDAPFRGRREPVPELLRWQRVDQNASAPQCST